MESELESLNTSQSWSAERGDVQDLLHQEFRYEELMYTTPSNAEEIALKLKVDEACKNFLLGKKGIREAAAELAINPEIIRGELMQDPLYEYMEKKRKRQRREEVYHKFAKKAVKRYLRKRKLSLTADKIEETTREIIDIAKVKHRIDDLNLDLLLEE